jgi:hypothetical protein
MNPIGTALKAIGTAGIAAFSAAGAAALASGQVIEKYRMSLTTLMGSSEAAGKAVANALNLASKTPFTDDQLLAATVALQKFGQDAKTILPQVANMAAATNGDVEEAAQAFGTFLQGRVKALQSYGITKAQVLEEGAKTEQGIQIVNQKGQIVNEEAFQKALLSLMDKRFKEGAELQANSLAGLIAHVKDAGEDILRTIAGFSDDGTIRAGSLFDFFKQGITAVLAKVEEWKANGSLQKWADDASKAIAAFFSTAKTVFGWMVDIGTWIKDHWQAITPVLGAVLGAFLAFKVVTGVIDGIAIAVAALKDVIVVTNGVMALTPIGAIMLAVAALAAVVVAATQAWRDYDAAMKLTTLPSEHNIQVYKKQLEDLNQSNTYHDPAERVALEKKINDEIAAVRGQSLDKQAKAQKDAADQVAAAEKQQRDAKTQADKDAAATALAAAKANAEAVAKVNSNLADKLYHDTHTTVQNQIYDLAKERDAAIAAGGSRVDAEKVFALESAKVYQADRDARAKAAKEAADAADKAFADFSDKQVQATKDAYDTYISALNDYTSKQKDVRSTLTQAIIDNYGVEEDAAVKALEKERDATDKTINAAIDKRNQLLDTTLAAIAKEKDAALGQYDSAIAALQAQHEQQQRAETLAGLRADVANAATPEERLRAQKALDKELADEAYQDKLNALRSERQATADSFEKQAQTAKDAAKADIDLLQQEIKDNDAAYNDPTTGKIAAVTSYYDNLKLLRNADAEAEKMLAGKTQSEIMSMLQGRLDEWKGLGTQIGDSLYSGLQGAIGALSTLITTDVPVAPASGGGGGGISMVAHANGGYFTTPHVGLVAEKEPEWVVPQSRAAEFAGKMGGNTENLLRELTFQVRQLQQAVMTSGAGVVSAIRG